jgi:ABC-type lipoprotein release transport system permease subunit
MTFWRLVAREILYRKVNFALGVVSVLVAVGCLVGELSLLRAHDLRTQARMARLNDEMRKEMKKLGFNILILPKDQNLADLYATDYASKHMPEEYVKRLANSKIMTVRHLLPSLRKKIEWREQGGRVALLIGVRGEVPVVHRSPKKPILYPVPPGTVIVGYHLHKPLGLKKGDTVTILGREFTVHQCNDERGSKDDIALWANLEEAQALLDKEGQINEIMALKCQCAGMGILQVRKEIQRILPDTQVVEFATKAMARARAREAAAAAAQETRAAMARFAAWLVPIVTLGAIVWIGFLAFANVRDRRQEIGILRAVGVGSRRVFLVFLAKAVLFGIVGAALGYVGGTGVGWLWGDVPSAEGYAALFDPLLLLGALLVAPLLACLASWLPALMAAQQDPAVVLRDA